MGKQRFNIIKWARDIHDQKCVVNGPVVVPLVEELLAFDVPFPVALYLSSKPLPY